MICSQARLDANRRNCLKSTGPKTPEGKERSRANALKHGLCASVVVSEDLPLIQARAEEIYRALKPNNDYQAWHVDRAAVMTLRIERCERMERRIRDKVALRAELTWDDDRRLEAEVLGGMLAKKPSETVEALRRSPHGCEWLMTRWALLAHAADTNPSNRWTEDQTTLAFDLLATPAQFRAGRKPGASIDFEGNVVDLADDSAAVARRMVAELRERREVVDGLDEVEQVLAGADLDHDSDAQLRRLRRYESTLHRRFRWAVGQITASTHNLRPDPGLVPRWLEAPIPTPQPDPMSADEKAAAAHPSDSFSPPFDLEPDEYPEPGQKADIPLILESRRVKRIAKAEARRRIRRRQLDALRA
jgi:hypothetical protein